MFVRNALGISPLLTASCLDYMVEDDKRKQYVRYHLIILVHLEPYTELAGRTRTIVIYY